MIFNEEDKAIIEKKFWEKVHIPENGDDPKVCWTWTGAKRGTGKHQYGIISFKNKIYAAHRLRWILQYGTIPADRFVCHFCDNPPCVRLEHIWMGTRAQNEYDKQLKGRGCIRISLMQRTEVIKRFFYDKESVLKIAKDFNTSSTLIFNIVKRPEVVKMYGRRPPIGTRITPDKYEEIYLKFLNNKSIVEIAEEYKVSPSAIGTITVRPELQEKFGKRFTLYLTKEKEKKDAEISELYKTGEYSQKKLAIKYNVSPAAINRALKRRQKLEQYRSQQNTVLHPDKV